MGDSYAVRNANDPYFLTITVVDWMDLFSRLYYRHIVVDSLNYCIRHKGLVVHAWVIMSNHLHLVAYAKEGAHLGHLMRDFKRHTSKAIRRAIEDEPESRREWLLDRMAFLARVTKRAEQFKLWKDGVHAIDVSAEWVMHQKITYIHNNPVKNGLVDLPEHYRFSSARDYFTGQKGLVEVELA